MSVHMMGSKIDKKVINYHSVNDDFTGTRYLNNTEEVVEYNNSSTVRIWFNEQTYDFDTHWHSALEVIAPSENWYDVTVNQVKYHVLPGEFIFIPPGELHSLSAPASGTRFIFLFDIGYLNRLKGFAGIQSLLAQPIYVSKDSYPLIYDDICEYMEQIKTNYFEHREYAELSINALLIQTFVKFGYHLINLFSQFSNVKQNKQKEYVQKFNQLLDYIDEHYTEDLTLECIAETVGFSKYHFSRLFKLYTNFTFYDYLTYRRLKVAESLLIDPELSITEVALQSGFQSISTFNRVFKQAKSCTPSEYRNKNSQPRFLH